MLQAIADSADVASWLVAQLEAAPRTGLRSATVVLPSPRMAHQLRRQACLSGRADLLSGVRLARAEDVARDVLARTGVAVDPSLQNLRIAALRTLFLSAQLAELDLSYFDAATLATGRGYAEAIAATIADLEDAAIGPGDLIATARAGDRETDGLDGDPRRLRDLALLWEAVDTTLQTERVGLVSPPQLLRRAARALLEDSQLALPHGHAIAVIGLHPTTPLLRFLAALSPAATALLVGRPVRTSGQRVLDVLGTVLGPAAPAVPQGAEDARREIDLVRRYLFAAPEELSDPDRARSPGADGSVTLEQHPGVQREIEAAVAWVVDEIVVHRSPLEEIALIVPSRDPLSALLASALERRDKGAEADVVGPRGALGEPSIPTYVAGGLPLTDCASGVFLLGLLRALRDRLPAEGVIPLLPRLRLEGEETLRLGEAAARELTYASGIVGGIPGDPARGCEWRGRFERRLRVLSAEIERMSEDSEQQQGDDPEKVRWALSRSETIRTRDFISALLPAIRALTEIVVTVNENNSLAAVWPLIDGFVQKWTRLPPGPPDVRIVLSEAIEGVLQSSIGQQLRGIDALEYLESALRSARTPHGRFGEPRVFIGTPSDALGLTFRAVRVVGAVEGALPSTPHEDPILPDAERDRVEQFVRAGGAVDVLLERSGTRVLRETHAAFLAITAARERLALSASRRSVDGTDRELSGIMLEAAVAIGRSDSESGGTDVIPSISTFRRLYIDAGLQARRDADRARPSIASLVLKSSTASGTCMAVPPSWVGPLVPEGFELGRLRTIQASCDTNELTAADGVLGTLGRGLRVAGLGAEKTISASALKTLLECPHRFLLERILHLGAPSGAPSVREIGQPDYGSLVHSVVQTFFESHGAAFCAHDQDLVAWIGIARDLASEHLEDFLHGYPLAGQGAIADQGVRLARDVEHLLRSEWEGYSGLTFIGVERPFGYGAPVVIPAGGGRELHVAGFIDRIDRQNGRLVLRDVKTGRPKPNDDFAVDFALDAQLALYAMVASEAAGTPGTPVGTVAYVHPQAAGDSERRFEGSQLDELLGQARGWFGIAAGLLDQRSFPRAADGDRCKYCDFKPVCGDDASDVSRRKLGALPSSDPLALFLSLQRPPEATDAD